MCLTEQGSAASAKEDAQHFPRVFSHLFVGREHGCSSQHSDQHNQHKQCPGKGTVACHRADCRYGCKPEFHPITPVPLWWDAAKRNARSVEPDVSGPGMRGRPSRRTADGGAHARRREPRQMGNPPPHWATVYKEAATMQDSRAPAMVPSPTLGIRKARTRSARA